MSFLPVAPLGSPLPPIQMIGRLALSVRWDGDVLDAFFSEDIVGAVDGVLLRIHALQNVSFLLTTMREIHEKRCRQILMDVRHDANFG